ncbi:MAG TPA: 3-deoxy-7-phosphoheptulonate synthase [Fimbriimonadaceae bacterium]|nr:3-deoxy-7-phosphoheptulonate synthase [Fimbriimonadaceae bacterium]
MRRNTEDLRILQTRPLIPPAILHEELPVDDAVSELIFESRQAVANILHGRDLRLLAIVGPCSIHDPAAALAYAERLKEIAAEVSDKILVVMRAYFEKPRTTVGWKGFINDPDVDETFQVNKGLRLARKLLLDINAFGMPTGSEFLDLQIPQHIADVTSWVAIGARTTESQVHRELASGLSMPVGFKNTTEGSLTPAVEAVQTARTQHWFPSVTKQAVSAIFQTTGNPDCHIILRGGSRTGPNYDEESVSRAVGLLEKKGLPARVMVDCSHGNSKKDYRLQGEVLREVARQVRSGSRGIMGVMIESNLVEGRQERPAVFGQSITDGCVGIEETRTLLDALAGAIP